MRLIFKLLIHRYVTLTVVLVFNLLVGSGWLVFAIMVYLLAAGFLFTCKTLARY